MKKLRKILENQRKKKIAYISPFEEGYALAIMKDECLMVLINEKYKVVEKTSFFYFNHETIVEELLKNGYAAIRNLECVERNSKCFLVDRNLRKIEGLEYNNIDICQSSNNAYVLVERLEKRTSLGLLVKEAGLLDKNLNTIFELKYRQITHLGGSRFAVVEYNSDEMEIYDLETGERRKVPGERIVTEFTYADQTYYKVSVKDKYGIYDNDFNCVIEPEFDILSDVKQDGTMSFMQEGRKRGSIHILTKEKQFE